MEKQKKLSDNVLGNKDGYQTYSLRYIQFDDICILLPFLLLTKTSLDS